MILAIIFSFDRAMQLELLLESIFKYDATKQFDLHVVYASSSTDFEKGYELIKSKFSTIQWHKETSFKERKVWPLFPLYWRNYYWWLKYKYSRTVKSNFRSLVLSVMDESKNDSVMFLTDDSMFVNPIDIQPELMQKLELNGQSYSYSLRHGKNILGGNYAEMRDFIEWDITKKHDHSEWSYPFSVDGHIYNKKILLHIYRKVIFKNPNTLEGNVACYIRDKKLFKKVLANKQSYLLGFELNRVQTISDNNNLNISSKTLNDLYLEGFHLNLDFTLTAKHLFRPMLNRVVASKNNQTILLYGQK